MLSLLLIAACGGSVAAAPKAAITSQISVTANASPTSIGLSQTSLVTATVTNDQNGAGVTWALAAGAPGSLQSSDALHTTYTAPAQAGASVQVVVTATSVADHSKSAPAAITVDPSVAITGITADTTAALGPLQATDLTATAVNDNNAGVTWSLAAGATGTLTQEDPYHAAYTAPAAIAAAASYTVTAISNADSSKKATITVAVAPPPATAPAAWQGLVQFAAGLGRNACKPYGQLAITPVPSPKPQTDPCTGQALQVSGAVNPQWQPNLLIFHDTQSGTEIWRLSNDPSDTIIPGVVNRTAWNSNGSYFVLNSSRNPTESPYGNTGDWLYDARGGMQTELAPFDPNRQPSWTQPLSAGTVYLPFDRVDPNVVYFVDWSDNNQNTWNASHAFLYAVNLGPNAQGKRFQATAVADLPNSTDPVTGIQSVTVRKEIRSQLADNDHILINDLNPIAAPATNDPGGYPQLYLYDASTIDSVLAANASANPQNPLPSQLSLLEPPFSVNFNLDLPQDIPCAVAGSGVGNSTNPCHSVSEEWHVHDIGISRNVPNTVGLNYGSRTAVGEYVDFTVPVPYNGLASSIKVFYPNGNEPYLSHPGISEDGTEASYYGEDVLNDGKFGVWLRSLATNTPIREYEAWSFSAGHNDWSGSDPKYFVFDGNCQAANGAPPCPSYAAGGGFSLYEGLADPTANFASSGRGDRILVTYPTSISPGIYSPTQSPDATKVMFTIPDGFAPANSSCNSATGCETTYLAVSHRPVPPALSVTSTAPVTLSWVPSTPNHEIAGYHVYRNGGGSAAFTEVSNGLVTSTTFTDSSAVAGQTYTYAVTAEEYSGLESNQLSNQEQVTGGGAASQTAAAGATGWDTNPPAPPTGLTVASVGNNVWQVSWAASTSNDVRYYDVYVSFGSAPQATPAFLVDSPPLGQTSYIYWQGDPNVKPVFGVTAMDRQDNPSTMACMAAIPTSQACVGH